MRKKSPRNSGRYSPRAALVAVGLKVSSLKLLEPVKQKVVILQKSLRHTPAQKLQDAFIAILAGAYGLSEINTRVRSDEALQRAFGRGACADQSVVQETLNACTELNKGAPQVSCLAEAFRSLLKPQRIAVDVGQI